MGRTNPPQTLRTGSLYETHFCVSGSLGFFFCFGSGNPGVSPLRLEVPFTVPADPTVLNLRVVESGRTRSRQTGRRQYGVLSESLGPGSYVLGEILPSVFPSLLVTLPGYKTTVTSRTRSPHYGGKDDLYWFSVCVCTCRRSYDRSRPLRSSIK